MTMRGQIIVNCVNLQARQRAGFPDKPEITFVIICEFNVNGGALFASFRCVLCRIAPHFVPNDDAFCTKPPACLVQNAERLGTKRRTDFVNMFQASRNQSLAKCAENRIFQRDGIFLLNVAVFSVKIHRNFC